MKKLIILFLFIFLVNINLVSAKDITFNDIALKYKEKFNYSDIDASLSQLFDEFEKNATINTSANKIEVKYQLEDKTYTTTFIYQNNFITYTYAGSKDLNNYDINHNLADSAAIFKLFYIILGLKGYSIEEITAGLQDFDEEQVSMANNGVEFTTYKLEYNDDSSHMSMSGIDTMKLDINKLNFGKNNNSNSNNVTPPNNNNSNSSSNNVENPKTGYKQHLIISGIILLIMLVFIKLKKSSNVLNKI